MTKIEPGHGGGFGSKPDLRAMLAVFGAVVLFALYLGFDNFRAKSRRAAFLDAIDRHVELLRRIPPAATADPSQGFTGSYVVWALEPSAQVLAAAEDHGRTGGLIEAVGEANVSVKMLAAAPDDLGAIVLARAFPVGRLPVQFTGFSDRPGSWARTVTDYTTYRLALAVWNAQSHRRLAEREFMPGQRLEDVSLFLARPPSSATSERWTGAAIPAVGPMREWIESMRR